MKDFTVILWEELGGKASCFFSSGTAVTIGGFDGPHLGHKVLFDKVLKEAETRSIPSGVVTFIRSPEALKKKDGYAGDVSTLRLRLKKFFEFGFDFVILIDFSHDFARMSGIVFVDTLLNSITMQYLAVGTDFCCGYRRQTTAGELKSSSLQKGFHFDSVGQICLDGKSRISSTAIRAAVSAADFSLANRLLGYPFLFDITGISWFIDGAASMQTHKKFLTQVLPKDGRYPVAVNLTDGSKKEACFLVNGEYVSIQFKKEGSDNFIKTQLNNFDTVEFLY